MKMPARLSLSALAALASLPALAQPTSVDDRLSVFGQEVSMAVDRAADLSVYAALCGVGSDAAAMNLRDAVARRIAECFKSDSKAATWAADVVTHFDGKRALMLDVARTRGKDAFCGRLHEGDGKTLSAFGKEVVADGQRYATSGASAPIASRPCP